jgi:anti-sigma B factor antagonist
MKLSTRTEGQLHIISVMEDRIDAAVARAFKEAMRDMIEDGPPPVVILDLGQVNFIDSSGLGAVVATLKLLLPDRSLTLAGLTPSVDRVFRLTRMDSVFPLFPTLDAALAAQVPA